MQSRHIVERPRVRMTADEFLALPDDGVHRELLNGEVRVICQETWDDPNAPILPIVAIEKPVIIHNRFHSRIEVKFAFQLESWVQQQPRPRGEVVCGECGFRMGGPGDAAVGIDVAYVSAEVASSVPSKGPSKNSFQLYYSRGCIVWARLREKLVGRCFWMAPKQRIYESPPVLAVEILSPSDTSENIAEMIETYHRHGVIVWVANPDFRTVAVHRPNQFVEYFNEVQDLVGDPELPGFRVAVADLFD